LLAGNTELLLGIEALLFTLIAARCCSAWRVSDRGHEPPVRQERGVVRHKPGARSARAARQWAAMPGPHMHNNAANHAAAGKEAAKAVGKEASKAGAAVPPPSNVPRQPRALSMSRHSAAVHGSPGHF